VQACRGSSVIVMAALTLPCRIQPGHHCPGLCARRGLRKDIKRQHALSSIICTIVPNENRILP